MPKLFDERKTVGTCIRVPEDLLEKLRIIKSFYKGSISLYIVTLIEKDLKENGEKYKARINF